MEKFFPKPEQRMPLELLLNKIGSDLFLIFAGNGYRNLGFSLIVQELDGDQQMAQTGNLRPVGLKVLLENLLCQMEVDDETDRASPPPQ